MKGIEKILRIRILRHLLFWSISAFILLKDFRASSEPAPTDFIYTGIFMVFLAFSVYVNLLWLIPAFFDTGKTRFYFPSVVLLVGLTTYIQIFSFDSIVDRLFPGYYLITYFDFWETLNYFIVFVGISSLLHFSKSWFLYRETEAKLTKIQKEKAEAELEALKNQINPHFLFNSLNSIYSLVLHQSGEAPQALIKLSDGLRYVIYESDREKTSLKKELDFIKDYIALQKLRMSDKDQLSFDLTGEVKNRSIAPLLLIPIVENCFKYGIKGDTEASYVQIKIDVGPEEFIMETKNNLGSADPVEKSKAGGTGLTNLRKRLALIYPGRHELSTNRLSDSFEVHLKISL